jgi:two-component system, OmpR family, sensor histidine kinase MtrB
MTPRERVLTRVYSLRAALTGVIALLAGLTILVGLALASLTTSLHDVSASLTASVESIRLTSEVETGLLVHARTTDPLARARHERGIRSRLSELERYVTTDPERAAFVAAQRAADQYFADVSRAELGPDALDRGLDSTFRSFAALTEINVDQARAARLEARRTDRVADVIALAAGGVLLGLAVGVLWWLNAKVYRPTLSLAHAIQRFAEGDRAARAPESGPTELREMAARFNRLASALATQRKAQSAFLAGVAHDLRTPLNALQLSTALVPADRPLPPEDRIRKTLGVVNRQVARLERMVGDFLDMSRIDAGELELDLEQSDARELAREVVELFQSTSSSHRLELSMAEQPVLLQCDPVRIGQVLTNLVSNAIKYSAEGSQVFVDVAERDGRVRFSVTDSGLGILPEEQSQIFEPFRRLKRTGTEIPGVGLGLFVSRRIVEAHGGRLEVESRPGEGSRFEVVLPLGRVQPLESMGASRAQDARATRH